MAGVLLSDMEFFRPATWADALAIKAEQPAARAIAGGTDLMVEINFDRSRPEALLDLTGVADLAEWSADGPVIRLGAGVPYARVISELGDRLPGLAGASRTVGSPGLERPAWRSEPGVTLRTGWRDGGESMARRVVCLKLPCGHAVPVR